MWFLVCKFVTGINFIISNKMKKLFMRMRWVQGQVDKLLLGRKFGNGSVSRQ